jgi:membrane-bound lytic murein transglycosylase B
MALANQISIDNDLPNQWVEDQLLKAKSLSKIKQLVLPPSNGVKKNWLAYKERFLSESRILGGRDFAQKNWPHLEKAQSLYQVPWEIIVAIIGVETFYGKNMGYFKALDVLTSLSMDFPMSHPRAQEREAFFRQELGALLKLMQKTRQSAWVSSYAGAMGLPQFMPSNWHKFAVDFDEDGRIDLNASQADAIGSVGNYLAKFGWQPQMPTHFEIDPNFDKTHLQELLLPDILPSFKSQQFMDWGLPLTPTVQSHTGPLALVMLENAEAEPSYVLGTENFYTLTRYNWSSYYALAVIELSAAIKAAMRD